MAVPSGLLVAGVGYRPLPPALSTCLTALLLPEPRYPLLVLVELPVFTLLPLVIGLGEC